MSTLEILENSNDKKSPRAKESQMGAPFSLTSFTWKPSQHPAPGSKGDGGSGKSYARPSVGNLNFSTRKSRFYFTGADVSVKHSSKLFREVLGFRTEGWYFCISLEWTGRNSNECVDRQMEGCIWHEHTQL